MSRARAFTTAVPGGSFSKHLLPKSSFEIQTHYNFYLGPEL